MTPRIAGIVLSLLVLGVGLTGNIARAENTVQDFSAIFPDAPPPVDILLSQDGSEPPAGLVNDETWDGSFLRLTEEVNDQRNRAAWNQVYSGAYDELRIDFDFRISEGNNTGADGIGLTYMNSENYGTDTTTPTPAWLPEEPNLVGSFGVGFDTFNNADQNDGGENSVSLHWDNALVISEPIDFESDIFTFEDGVVRGATVVVTPSGAGSQVVVSITEDGFDPIVPIDEFVDGFLPYDGRFAIAGRTGGANADQDIDNLRLSVTPVGGNPTVLIDEPFNSLPDPPPTGDDPVLLGGTAFEGSQFSSQPGPTLTQGNGPELTDGFLRLATQVGSQLNTIAFDRTADSLADTIVAEFDFRILDEFGGSGIADGMSFVMMPTDQYGDDGPTSGGLSEEPNLAGAFGIGFDTFDNDEEGFQIPEGCGDLGSCDNRRANHVSLHWDGQLVDTDGDGFSDNLDIRILDPAEFDLVNGEWNHATVQVDQVQDGANVTLTLQDATGAELVVFDQQFVEFMEFPESARVAFGARTGGAADHHDIDNVLIQYEGVSEALLQPGDADENFTFDQLDLVKVQIAAKYLTGEQASWGDGDWNGAPAAGGVPGNPPPGDGQFDQIDIIAALNAGLYLTGPYAALAGEEGTGDGNVTIVYNVSGELSLEVPGTPLTSINIDSASGIFTGEPGQNLEGSFDNDSDDNIFKATFGDSFGSLTFGNVAQPGLSKQFVIDDLSAVGSLLGGGGLGAVDLRYIPEPSSVLLLVLGLAGALAVRRRRQ